MSSVTRARRGNLLEVFRENFSLRPPVRPWGERWRLMLGHSASSSCITALSPSFDTWNSGLYRVRRQSKQIIDCKLLLAVHSRGWINDARVGKNQNSPKTMRDNKRSRVASSSRLSTKVSPFALRRALDSQDISSSAPDCNTFESLIATRVTLNWPNRIPSPNRLETDLLTRKLRFEIKLFLLKVSSAAVN